MKLPANAIEITPSPHPAHRRPPPHFSLLFFFLLCFLCSYPWPRLNPSYRRCYSLPPARPNLIGRSILKPGLPQPLKSRRPLHQQDQDAAASALTEAEVVVAATPSRRTRCRSPALYFSRTFLPPPPLFSAEATRQPRCDCKTDKK